MGTIVVTEFVSLDGVMEAPGPDGSAYEHAGWTFDFNRGDDGDRFKLDEVREAAALLLGRVTYEGFAAAWPERPDGEFAEKMNGMPKYVFSNTLEHAGWSNSAILRGDLGEAAAELRDRVDGVILVAGSGRLVRGLLEHGLVDELRLMVFPVVLGRGQRLFGDDAPAKAVLRLTEARTVGDGVEVLTYARA